MPKILSTAGCSNTIERIIDEARKYIVIVSPFLDIPDILYRRLIQADRKKVKIQILFGKKEIDTIEKKKLLDLKNLNLYYKENLHGKCYLNESIFLISSMNLYEYSLVNNWEIGILIEENEIILKNKLLSELDILFAGNEIEIISEKFERFELVEKIFLEELAMYLNEYFDTDKFQFKKIFREFDEREDFELNTVGFPQKEIDMYFYKDGARIDFEILLSGDLNRKLGEEFNFDLFEDDFRVYFKRPYKVINMYYSIYHRDRVHRYSYKTRFEYIAKGIEKMKNYLEEFLKNNS